jgi:hypothetical protein
VKPHVRFRIQYCLEQIFFGAVVLIEAAASHACFLKNLRNTRRMYSGPAEQAAGGQEQLFLR